MDQMNLGLQVMGYGMAGVFTVIVLFYLMTKLIVKIFPYKEDQ